MLVDGVDVRDQELDALRSRMGLVPQRAYLFSGTIANNLRFAKPDATEAELWHALDVAQASDFVREMPGQLDAAVDQGGSNLSGGQRQRMSIARALVRRPGMYLFDDCFSALDAATDARLRAALKADTRNATVLIVAQRVSTILHADQIIVLEEGRMTGVGTHEELLRTCPEYREIVTSQLGEGRRCRHEPEAHAIGGGPRGMGPGGMMMGAPPARSKDALGATQKLVRRLGPRSRC